MTVDKLIEWLEVLVQYHKDGLEILGNMTRLVNTKGENDENISLSVGVENNRHKYQTLIDVPDIKSTCLSYLKHTKLEKELKLRNTERDLKHTKLFTGESRSFQSHEARMLLQHRKDLYYLQVTDPLLVNILKKEIREGKSKIEKVTEQEFADE